MIKRDAIIVGGGPAGAACAWRLQRFGVDTLILDQAEFPRAKPCAGWVTPQVFKSLEIAPEDYPFGLTKFTSFKISLRGIKFRLPTLQYAIRRIEFDNWLLTRSEAKITQHRVVDIQPMADGYRIDEKFSAKYLIGAGGTHCPVRRLLFEPHQQTKKTSLIIAREEEFRYPIIDDRCHLWFFSHGLPGYAWYLPKTGGYLNVGIGASASGLKARGETLDQHWHKLSAHLQSSGLVFDHEFNPKGYSYYLRGKSMKIRHGNALLVGDALGLATRDMGEGIGAAIHSGLAAANSIAEGVDYSISRIPRFSLPSLLRLRP